MLPSVLQKNILIGWKHKYSSSMKFMLKTGAKHALALFTSKQYDYEYIVEEGIK